MGTVDIVTKEYMRENAVFADAFNYLIYNGKKVIDPAKLKEIDRYIATKKLKLTQDYTEGLRLYDDYQTKLQAYYTKGKLYMPTLHQL